MILGFDPKVTPPPLKKNSGYGTGRGGGGGSALFWKSSLPMCPSMSGTHTQPRTKFSKPSLNLIRKFEFKLAPHKRTLKGPVEF
jgi:hypothetical protein